ncbi:hypothetical protein Dip518_000239 [Parelusimicrobium proximum]|uniref:hypothetical protein n=1 Tax=Parelusimicrobium proximum TaxID=3228953 RepID=UPI003D17A23B
MKKTVALLIIMLAGVNVFAQEYKCDFSKIHIRTFEYNWLGKHSPQKFKAWILPVKYALGEDFVEKAYKLNEAANKKRFSTVKKIMGSVDELAAVSFIKHMREFNAKHNASVILGNNPDWSEWTDKNYYQYVLMPVKEKFDNKLSHNKQALASFRRVYLNEKYTPEIRKEAMICYAEGLEMIKNEFEKSELQWLLDQEINRVTLKGEIKAKLIPADTEGAARLIPAVK